MKAFDCLAIISLGFPEDVLLKSDKVRSLVWLGFPAYEPHLCVFPGIGLAGRQSQCKLDKPPPQRLSNNITIRVMQCFTNAASGALMTAGNLGDRTCQGLLVTHSEQKEAGNKNSLDHSRSPTFAFGGQMRKTA